MHVDHISSFSISPTQGGNPAGVVICEALPCEDKMQAIAAKVGYSETVFSCQQGDKWRTRYFSPINEVPFCGHATIALGAVLAHRFGSGTFALQLNGPEISVEGQREGDKLSATLTSPPTSSTSSPQAFLSDALALFELEKDDLHPALAPVIADGGARHLILPLGSRKLLADMNYDLAQGARIMAQESLITIMLVHAETDRLFHVRNAFASGGVFEDPATGAAAAAFGGYLNKINWPHGGEVRIIQGEDMRMTSELGVSIAGPAGAPVRVSGAARYMEV